MIRLALLVVVIVVTDADPKFNEHLGVCRRHFIEQMYETSYRDANNMQTKAWVFVNPVVPDQKFFDEMVKTIKKRSDVYKYKGKVAQVNEAVQDALQIPKEILKKFGNDYASRIDASFMTWRMWLPFAWRTELSLKFYYSPDITSELTAKAWKASWEPKKDSNLQIEKITDWMPNVDMAIFNPVDGASTQLDATHLAEYKNTLEKAKKIIEQYRNSHFPKAKNEKHKYDRLRLMYNYCRFALGTYGDQIKDKEFWCSGFEKDPEVYKTLEFYEDLLFYHTDQAKHEQLACPIIMKMKEEIFKDNKQEVSMAFIHHYQFISLAYLVGKYYDLDYYKNSGLNPIPKSYKEAQNRKFKISELGYLLSTMVIQKVWHSHWNANWWKQIYRDDIAVFLNGKKLVIDPAIVKDGKSGLSQMCKDFKKA